MCCSGGMCYRVVVCVVVVVCVTQWWYVLWWWYVLHSGGMCYTDAVVTMLQVHFVVSHKRVRNVKVVVALQVTMVSQ